ncbi:hypothetical protein KAR91_43625 [Candidatus Pacearchaeota archaeon]|nr:hypothetical protein [Candidatus Pacearchaeota archaeon]
MKKGDVVTIRDGSYSRSVINGESIHEIGLERPNEQFRVIEVDCKFPVIDLMQPQYELVPTFNNTVIQAIDSGKVVFIEERFLRPVLPKHKVMIDMVGYCGCAIGMICEISDKLYQEIKRES